MGLSCRDLGAEQQSQSSGKENGAQFQGFPGFRRCARLGGLPGAEPAIGV